MADDQTTNPNETQDDDATLPKEASDAVTVLKRYAKEHGESIVAEFKGSALYQIPFQSGHSTATKSFTDPEKGKLTKAEARIAELEGEVAKAAEGKPDLEKVKSGYLRQLSERDAKLAEKDKTIATLEGESVGDKLSAELSPRLRASAAKLASLELRGRIRPKADAPGGYVLLSQESPDVEIAIPRGKTVFQFAAEEAVKNADPDDVLAGGNSGGGRTNGGNHRGLRDVKTEDIQKQQRAAGIGPSI